MCKFTVINWRQLQVAVRMFDGSSEQFHQHFIASSATSLPFPLPLHSFEPYPPQLSSSSSAAAKMEIRSDIDDHRPWSNDELLSLLKLRSTMEIWFPDFTWEHVSRFFFLLIN